MNRTEIETRLLNDISQYINSNPSRFRAIADKPDLLENLIQSTYKLCLESLRSRATDNVTTKNIKTFASRSYSQIRRDFLEERAKAFKYLRQKTGQPNRIKAKLNLDKLTEIYSVVPGISGIKRRAVYVLREFGQFSQKEVAEILDMAVGTVSPTLHEARMEVQKLVKGEVT